MKRDERLAEYKAELLDELNLCKEEPVIVEGRNDVEALHERGFVRILTVNRGKGLYDFSVDVKQINGERVVLVLTDFDPEGERIAKKLEEYFQSVGCRTDRSERDRLRKLFKKNKLTTVQGLRNLESF